MTDAVRDMIARAMAGATDIRAAEAYAPSNIALSKYWGKRDAARNLPLNSSVSISLANWGSHTRVEGSGTGHDEVHHNGTLLDPGDAFARRALAFADLFRGGRHLPLRITTQNSIPTAAGLASSASGFAALTRALAGAFGLDLDDTDLSRIARIGSGSAARSIWHGFVRWNRGEAEDGHDSHGVPLDLRWPGFRIAIVAVDKGPKPFSSRDGMNHTVETSPLFPPWPAQAEADCRVIEDAIAARDMAALGPRVEANALAMHATMMAARPPLCYLTGGSWQVLERLWQARADGLAAFATMDAGPNVKLIFEESSAADVLYLFPDASLIAPFEGR
ncbi:diphosphomevalonate decarboxylase [Paracoccus zeaxanthinifaciens]|uniref:diphosphomevalonate decarboxylase n=1 Tax=Paracoccus zeaxanthinifaciens TaxID=187400 RepID=Q8L1I0_PARZE|nr:diphosphomevalonate decarboxylase [Paracoccus zeaxanthinifaciens]CAD24423.1 mevalonate diphosphate decarboxylase [Paracoccus zeaxanthinifaciens]